MDRKILTFITLALSMLYGISVGVFADARGWLAPLGAVVVALAWIAVGMFGKSDKSTH